MGEWRYNSIIPNLGTRQRRVISFKLLPLYSRESPWYLLYKGLVVSRAGLDIVEKGNNFADAGKRTIA
jgi:hypothetical protein